MLDLLLETHKQQERHEAFCPPVSIAHLANGARTACGRRCCSSPVGTSTLLQSHTHARELEVVHANIFALCRQLIVRQACVKLGAAEAQAFT